MHSFEVVARLRPLDLLGPGRTLCPPDRLAPLPRPGPYATVRATVCPSTPAAGRVTLTLTSGTDRLTGWWDPVEGRVGLDVTTGGRSTTHVSRRFGALAARPQALALTLTGTHLTWLTEQDGTWTARARYDLRDRVDVRDETWLAGLNAGAEEGRQVLREVTAGGFGQLGLRDVRLVTHADGTPYRDGRRYVLSATSAGPGFFDTAHASLWHLDLDNPTTPTLTHASDLHFRRPDRPGSYGDHAVHVVRDGDDASGRWAGRRWLVAASTWADFDKADNPSVRVTLAETTADLLTGEHLLDTRELPLPTDGFRSVGVWDPHLLRHQDRWWVGYVSARKYFAFHPVLATGPELDQLDLVAAATERRATEGTTLTVTPEGLRVLASDGRDNPRGLRERFPVLDTDLHEVGTLTAPYPTNIPWPTVIPDPDGPWLVTFNGAEAGGELLGYGTHGQVVLMRAASGQAYSEDVRTAVAGGRPR